MMTHSQQACKSGATITIAMSPRSILPSFPAWRMGRSFLSTILHTTPHAVEQLPKLEKHICSYSPGDLHPDTDFKYLLNFCNRHIKCRPGVCLKPTRDGGEKCKVGAPWTTSTRARIAIRKKYEFVPQRNDPLLNNVPRVHYTAWRANSDMQPVLSMHALLNYLSKYLTKAEMSSEEMRGVVHTVLRNDPNAKASSSKQTPSVAISCQRQPQQQ